MGDPLGDLLRVGDPLRACSLGILSIPPEVYYSLAQSPTPFSTFTNRLTCNFQTIILSYYQLTYPLKKSTYPNAYPVSVSRPINKIT